jgi:hypothetical protein
MNMLDEIRGRATCREFCVALALYGLPASGPLATENVDAHDAQDAAMLAVCEAAAEWVHWDDASDVFGERALEMRRKAECKLRDAVAALTRDE